MKNIKIAILISGTGSIMDAILKYFIDGKILDINNFIVISNKSDVEGVQKAKKYNVKTYVIESKKYKNRADFESVLHEKLIESKVNFIVLAGFMRILTANFVGLYENKIINTHPSLLPSFKGANAVEDALLYGVKFTGTTVHYVNAGVDEGKIIAQDVVEILPQDNLETLHEKIKIKERILYPRTIQSLLKLS